MGDNRLEKYGIYDDDGNRYGKTFNTYEDAEWYMKEHQNVGLIPEDCGVVDEINWE
jgi:hypothetical protein